MESYTRGNEKILRIIMNSERERPNMDVLQKDIQMIEKYLGISPDTFLSYNELRTFVKDNYEEALRVKNDLEDFVERN